MWAERLRALGLGLAGDQADEHLLDAHVAANQLGDLLDDRHLDTGAVPYTLRTPDEIAGFFAGLELVEPGVVSCPLWRPDPGDGPGRAVSRPSSSRTWFGSAGLSR